MFALLVLTHMAFPQFGKLSVCNASLDLLGEQPVSEVDEDSTVSPHARVLARQWPYALDELLRAFPWNWAKTRDTLAAYSGTPEFEWDYAFELPDDLVTLISINETMVGRPGDWWEIESGFLLTDGVASDDTAFVEYIARPTETTTDALLQRMDPLARNALVTLLASKVATQVCRDGGDKAAAMLQRYTIVDLPRARLRGAGESKAPWGAVTTDSAFDQSRFAGPAG